MDNELRIKLIYEDSDLLELSLSVFNGEFAGKGDFYVGFDALAELREAIRDFPRSSNDAREFIIGEMDPESARGGVRLGFSCVGLARRPHLAVEMITCNQPRRMDPKEMPAQRVVLWEEIEPAAVDQFVAEIAQIERRERFDAGLSFISS
jgi:hypothetical protein